MGFLDELSSDLGQYACVVSFFDVDALKKCPFSLQLVKGLSMALPFFAEGVKQNLCSAIP